MEHISAPMATMRPTVPIEDPQFIRFECRRTDRTDLILEWSIRGQCPTRAESTHEITAKCIDLRHRAIASLKNMCSDSSGETVASDLVSNTKLFSVFLLKTKIIIIL